MTFIYKYICLFFVVCTLELSVFAQQDIPENTKQKIAEGIEHLQNARDYSDIVYAIRDFNYAVRLAPEFPDAHYYLAKAYSFLDGTIYAAINEYQKYLDLKINPADSLSVIKEIINLKSKLKIDLNFIDGVEFASTDYGIYIKQINYFSQNFDKVDVGDKLIKLENEKINDNYKLNKLQSLFKKTTKNTILVSLKNSEGNIYNTTLNKAAAEEMIIYYNETKINSGRIGISYQLKSDTIFVTSVEKNGPSFKAGLKTGDKIVSIDKVKVNTFQNDYAKVSAKLRGEKGTKVSVDVLSKESNKITTIQITREIIKLK